MERYIVTSPVRHDGKDYAVGKVIELSEEQAAALIAAGAVRPAAEEKEEKKDARSKK